MFIEEQLKKLPELETERLLLRKVHINDLDDIYAFSSDPEVAKHMTWNANKSKEETLQNFVQVVIGNYQTGQSGDWAIVEKKTKKVIGTCAFIQWSNEHCEAEIGYVLNRHYWGKGLATEAISKVIQYGFECLHLNRIQGRCDPDHIGSEKVMVKSGMHYEGTLRKNERIKGEFKDTKVFSILKEEYERNIRKLNQNKLRIRERETKEAWPVDLLKLADPSIAMIEKYKERGMCFLAEKNAQLIGVYVLTPVRSRMIELVNLSVKEEYQQNGIGKQLVMDAIRTAKARGFNRMEVNTGNSSIGQLALYQKCGFRINSIDHNYFIRHYSETIIENGIVCRDRIQLVREL